MKFLLPSALHSLALPLLLSLLPSTHATTTTTTDSAGSAIALIRNNLNLYSILQDTKNFAALDQVFTQDASPIGLAGPTTSYPNNLTGIQQFLASALANVTTLHYSDTQFVELGPAGDTATAVSYTQAVYFAEDALVSGQVATYYESFRDEFVLRGGRWLSRNKTLQIFAIVGNRSVT
ncbi:hypothetical protein MMC24_003631 [Lignoscripta atroalba]|nr:hypothetical protein [Lignoscripta atroalba]